MAPRGPLPRAERFAITVAIDEQRLLRIRLGHEQIEAHIAAERQATASAPHEQRKRLLIAVKHRNFAAEVGEAAVGALQHEVAHVGGNVLLLRTQTQVVPGYGVVRYRVDSGMCRFHEG